MTLNWPDYYAERIRTDSGPTLGSLLGLDPDTISLAGGLPAPEFFPLEAIKDAVASVLDSDAHGALQYGPTPGYYPLREFLAERMSNMGVKASPEQVMITTGSQQGLDLVGRLLIDPGSTVVVEDPSYAGGLQAFDSCQARYLAVPIDDDGMRVELLEERLAGAGSRPRFIYALPNFQNPSGVTLSLERRRQLLDLAYRHRIPVVEDDPYGELRYDGEPLPSIKSMDAGGSVIYLGTFSKILAPGLRLGWIVAEEGVIEQLVKLKQGVDLHTDSLSQRIAYLVSRDGWLERQIQTVKPVYRERRDAMLRALERYLPPGSSWTRPQGGLFVWASLPEGIDTGATLPDALAAKVAYVPGVAFHPHKDRNNGMRLNFSYPTPERIDEGIRRLGEVVARHLPAEEMVPLPAAGTA
jgi:2-aminoadipate transaminase